MTFGYDESIETKMPYRQALADDIWVDDQNAEDYNRWVKKSETRAVSYEMMKRDDDLYKYGIVIEYNTDPVIKGTAAPSFCTSGKAKAYLRPDAWLFPKRISLKFSAGSILRHRRLSLPASQIMIRNGGTTP